MTVGAHSRCNQALTNALKVKGTVALSRDLDGLTQLWVWGAMQRHECQRLRRADTVRGISDLRGIGLHACLLIARRRGDPVGVGAEVHNLLNLFCGPLPRPFVDSCYSAANLAAASRLPRPRIEAMRSSCAFRGLARPVSHLLIDKAEQSSNCAIWA